MPLAKMEARELALLCPISGVTGACHQVLVNRGMLHLTRQVLQIQFILQGPCRSWFLESVLS